MPSPRRFPPPWSAKETDACFIVKDSAGQKPAFVVYFEEERGDARQPNCSAKMRLERIPANVAKLAKLLRKR